MNFTRNGSRTRRPDNDLIIRRTVTYAVVSALVVGVFAVVTALPSVVLGIDSDLFVAAATLLAAGVFRPLHARVRMAVDRRFNRSRFDADMTIQDLASRLRDDTDVDDLVVEVLHVLRATLEPASAAVLLRGPTGVYGATRTASSDTAMHQIGQGDGIPSPRSRKVAENPGVHRWADTSPDSSRV